MASINIDPPVSTPAHEWAANATEALHGRNTSPVSNQKTAETLVPTVTSTQGTGPTSEASTPGAEFPGAFPREAASQANVPSAEERTPHAAAIHLADAAPPKSTSDIQKTAKSYLPNVNVQGALDTAKAYLPQSVVGTVGSVLPESLTDETQTEKNIDPTSGAKPTSGNSASSDVTSLDNVSTTVNPSSTPRWSPTSGASNGENTPSASENAELGSALDGTSPAKPNVTSTESTHVPSTSTSAVSASPIPISTSQSASMPVNGGNAAVATHTLPTPPASKGNSTSETQTDERSLRPPGLDTSTENKQHKDTGDKTSPQPNVAGSDSAVTDDRSKDPSGPTPPPKEDVSFSSRPQETKEKPATVTQPKADTTPTHDYVKSGTAAGAHLPGTAPATGGGISSSVSPTSEISSPHVLEGTTKETPREEEIGQGAPTSSSGESLEGTGNEKKEGRVKKVVHKVKDKLSSRNH